MRVALISFTKEGAKTCRGIEIGLTSHRHQCKAYGMKTFAEEAGLLLLESSLSQWTADAFFEDEALVFVGACGIAVRGIAPYIKDKTIDPAVVVVDEQGKYAISLLSGHLGGANAFTLEIASILGAEPVITTATDLNQKFAVDEWAKKRHLWMEDMKIAKEISAAILNKETIGVSSDFNIEGQMPEHLIYVQEDKDLKLGFIISIHANKNPFQRTLRLVPKTISVGIGCRKGVSLKVVEDLLYKVLNEQKISEHAIEKICSINIKEEEDALIKLSKKLNVPFQVFPSEELKQLQGEFTSSDFVKHILGVDNVCERAAVLGSRGQLIVKKQALNGVTLAIAIRKEEYRWT